MSRQGQPPRVHYVHRLSFSSRERLVGVFVLVGLLIVFAVLLAKGKTAQLFQEKATFNAYLHHAEGLSTQSPVKVSGIDVGRVSSIDITSDNRIHVTFYVFERFHTLLRADSKAALSKLSLLGDSTIEIKAGSADLPMIPDGAEISIAEPMSMDEVIAELTPVVNQLKDSLQKASSILSKLDPDQIGGAINDVSVTLANLRVISDQLAKGKGVVGKVLFDDKLAAQLDKLGPVVDKTVHTVDDVGALVNDSRRAVEKVNEALKGVSDELTLLPTTMRQARRVMRTSDDTLQGMQRVWPLSKAFDKQEQPALLPAGDVNE